CTYIEIEQAARTHAVILSRPAWLWGAEMGANEHGVCIGNEGVWTKEPLGEGEALLGMDLVRLGLERGRSAHEALQARTALLERYGQGGSCKEEPTPRGSVLAPGEGSPWGRRGRPPGLFPFRVAEGTRNLSNQLSIGTEITAEHVGLRPHAQSQGWWDGDGEFDFAKVFSLAHQPRWQGAAAAACRRGEDGVGRFRRSMGSEVPQPAARIPPCMEVAGRSGIESQMGKLTASPPSPPLIVSAPVPLPGRSVFKPFVFVASVTPVPQAMSPGFGDEDPVRKVPRFQRRVDRRHQLYRAHQAALQLLETDQEQGQTLQQTMRELERQGLEAMKDVLAGRIPLNPEELADLFLDCVETEIKCYK
uniref:Secernin-2 n=1 Tax=Pelodiscus sinensis TaxID=13735 RepID=K7FB42_PELSI